MTIPLRCGPSGPPADLLDLLPAAGAGVLRQFGAVAALNDNLATGGAETELAALTVSVPAAEVDGSLLVALAPVTLSCDRQLLPNTRVRVNGTDRTLGSPGPQQSLLWAPTSDPAYLHWTMVGIVQPGSGGIVVGTNTVQLVTSCDFSTMFRSTGGSLLVFRFLMPVP